jgi:hypothetical protein
MPNPFLTMFSFAEKVDDPAAAIVAIVIVLLLSIVGLVIYFLPSVIAILRNHHQWGTMGVINLFFGWAFIGWVVSLAWAVSAARER